MTPQNAVSSVVTNHHEQRTSLRWLAFSQIGLAVVGFIFCSCIAFVVVPRLQPVKKMQADAILFPVEPPPTVDKVADQKIEELNKLLKTAQEKSLQTSDKDSKDIAYREKAIEDIKDRELQLEKFRREAANEGFSSLIQANVGLAKKLCARGQSDSARELLETTGNASEMTATDIQLDDSIPQQCKPHVATTHRSQQ